MGHIAAKDVYRKLGEKIDNLTMRAPWNKALYNILKELYTEEEADIVVKMPYGLSHLDRIAKITKYEKTRLREIIENLCSKGLVMDLYNDDDGEYYYMPSPIVIGIFEFTMMKMGQDLDYKKKARFFHEYMGGAFYAANFEHGEKVGLLRALPHEETVASFAEVLDYERAVALVEAHDKFAIGLCSCRHEKLHAGVKSCDFPLDTCSAFGSAADYLIRYDMAKEVSKAGMLENLSRTREMGLVHLADNVKQNIMYICHCCGCCCNILKGVNEFGFINTVVTSSFIARVDEEKCTGCGKCAKACPINAIIITASSGSNSATKKKARVDASICMGCGVCALKCPQDALKLVKREKRVLHPETTFQKLILSALERGNLQYQIFDDPQKLTHKAMRVFLGAFLNLKPIKKALVSDVFRSRFLAAMITGSKLQGKEWVTTL